MPAPAHVLVTGSRISRSDPTTTSSPVVVYSRDQILASGKLSIGDFLQSLTEHSNGRNTSVAQGGDGSTFVNLRGLGVNRTLVLLNGRRYVPHGAITPIDLTTIPAQAVERVEISRDAGSAVYGSDAIAGVVNLVTRRDWTGAEAMVVAGASSRGDGNAYEVAVTSGMSSERGGVLVSAAFDDTRPVWGRDRGWASGIRAYDQLEGPYTNSSTITPEARIVLSSSQRGQQVAGASQLYNDLMASCLDPVRSRCPASYVRDPSSPLGWTDLGASSARYDPAANGYLTIPERRVEAFTAAHLRLGELGRAYLEGSYVKRTSEELSAPVALTTASYGVVTSADNLYNPFGVDLTDVRRQLVELGPQRSTQEAVAYRLVVGVDGVVDASSPVERLAWDVSLSYAQARTTNLRGGNPFRPNLADALGPSYSDAAGPHCGTTGNPIDNCVPLDLFGAPGSIDRNTLENLTHTTKARSRDALLSAQASVTATLFRLAADRPAAVALGYELRRVEGWLGPEVPWMTMPIPEHDYAVNEGYAELLLPVASGAFLVDDLEASAAARVSRYSAFESQLSWSLGARWRVVPGLTLRGTYSTGFRVPSITELDSVPVASYTGASDPCSGVLRTPPASCGAAAGNADTNTTLAQTVLGNPQLHPETAAVLTVGAVFQPSLVEGLSLSVGYHDIEVTDAVSTLGVQFILAQCYPSNGSTQWPKYCELIQRDPVTHRITSIIDQPLNVRREATAGIDVGLRYALPTAVGRFGLGLDATWLRFHDRASPDGTVIHGRGNFDLAENGVGGLYPEWRINAGVTYAIGGLGAGLGMRYTGSIRECGDMYQHDGTTWSAVYDGTGSCFASQARKDAGEVPEVLSRDVGGYVVFDLTASYAFDVGLGRTTLGAGVDNLFDVKPRTIYNAYTTSTDGTGYDVLGRFFFARLIHAF